MEKPAQDREMQVSDLVALGYDRSFAQRILTLLSQDAQLRWYLREARMRGCTPITRISDNYPGILRKRLGLEAPGCLWAKGDLTLLNTPGIALVGSRDLKRDNCAFAFEAGRQAALQGYTLISGNARGADRTAQDACVQYSGKVICVVADSLETHSAKENVLYLSEEGFDLDFTAQRALSRNRIIHCLPKLTLVAQCTLGKGGTWDGTTRNLQKGCSPVFCFDDGSPAARELSQRGAVLISREALGSLNDLQWNISNFIDQ